MGDVIEFKRPPEDEPEIEHVDKTTIVERIELTDEIKAEFEKHGYNMESKE